VTTPHRDPGIPTTAIAASAYPYLNNLPVFEQGNTATALAGWGRPDGLAGPIKAELVRSLWRAHACE
jgi:hypothetical protein